MICGGAEQLVTDSRTNQLGLTGAALFRRVLDPLMKLVRQVDRRLYHQLNVPHITYGIVVGLAFSGPATEVPAAGKGLRSRAETHGCRRRPAQHLLYALSFVPRASKLPDAYFN